MSESNGDGVQVPVDPSNVIARMKAMHAAQIAELTERLAFAEEAVSVLQTEKRAWLKEKLQAAEKKESVAK